MAIELKISPPLLSKWLSDDEKRKKIIFLEFEADLTDDGSYRLDLNVAFKPIIIPRENGNRYSNYLGTTAVQIEIEIGDGTIIDHTPPETITVNYTNTITTERNVGLSLLPIIKEVSATMPITHQAGHKKSFTANFSSQERSLVPIVTSGNITWDLSQPRSENAIRDFLIGNLYLFATCEWNNKKRVGTISVRPVDIRFFDSKRRPLAAVRSLLMRYILWLQEDIRLSDADGFSVTFEEV